MNPHFPKQVFSLYRMAEKLKLTLRLSWLSDGKRQESVAEHTWMMCLLAMVVLDQLEHKMNLLTVLQIIIVHDLAEAITTDFPVWEGSQMKEKKVQAERAAMQTIIAPLDPVARNSILDAWEAYEAQATPEAKFVKALDKLDVLAQHNVSPISTWSDNDYLWQLSPIQDTYFNFDSALRSIKDELDRWSIEKVEAAGNAEKLDQEELHKRKKK